LTLESLERREVLTAAPGTSDLLPASDSGYLSTDKLTNLNNAGNDLAVLDDDFSNAATLANWQRVEQVEGWNISQLQTWDINASQPGRMVMIPHTVTWYQNYRGPMAFKEVTGNFIFTTEIHVSDRDDVGDSDADNVPDGASFSLGGVMIRSPRNITDPSQWTPGGEDYVFLSLGYGSTGSDFQFEVKTTDNSNSNLVLTTAGSDTATLRLVRIGNVVVTLRKLPGQDWVVHSRYRRNDFPETMQLGLVTYSDYGKVSSFDPFYHNGHALISGQVVDPTPGVPYRPDLVAGFEYARFARPVVPANLTGLDLFTQASDAQLLSFLGDTAGSSETLAPLQFTVPGTLAGADVRVYAGSTLIGRAIASGSTTVVTTGFGVKLAEGAHQFTATQRAPGDTTSTASGSLAVTIDTVRPTPTMASLTTGDRTPALSGTTSETLNSLSVTVGGQTYPGNLTGNTWLLADNTISPPLSAGTYDVAIAAVDLAGNQGTDATTGELTIQGATLQVASFTPTRSGFVAQFTDAIDQAVLNLYDQQNTLGPADVTLVGASSGVVMGSLHVAADARSATFIKSGEPLVPDTYTVSLRSGATAIRDILGNWLDGDARGVAGGDYQNTFVVASPAASTREVSIQDFARGFGQAVHLPVNAASGLPIILDNGQGVGRVDFTLHYDPALLSVTGASLASNLAGAALAFDNSQSGQVIVSITSPSSFSSDTASLPLLNLAAQVPIGATYGAKGLLDLTDLHVFTTGPAPSDLPVVDDDAIHVAAYFGDTNGSQTYNSPDATLVQRLIVGMGTGFVSYPLVDPHLIADASFNGVFQSNDVTLIQQAIVGMVNAAIPPLPGSALQSLTQPGDDPMASIAQSVSPAEGEAMTTSVNLLVTQPAGLTITGGEIVIAHDPADLQFVGVDLGELLQGFSWTVNASASGVVAISFAGDAPRAMPQGAPFALCQLQFATSATGNKTSVDLLQAAILDGDQSATLALIADDEIAAELAIILAESPR